MRQLLTPPPGAGNRFRKSSMTRTPPRTSKPSTRTTRTSSRCERGGERERERDFIKVRAGVRERDASSRCERLVVPCTLSGGRDEPRLRLRSAACAPRTQPLTGPLLPPPAQNRVLKRVPAPEALALQLLPFQVRLREAQERAAAPGAPRAPRSWRRDACRTSS
jgi:hypothetical protein